MIIKIIAAAIVIWLIFAIIIPLFILPNFYLKKLRKQKSEEITKIAKKLKEKSQEKTLKKVFKFVTSNYYGKERKILILNYPRLFEYDAEKNLKRKHRFLACHLQNWLIITILLNTNQFKKSQIKKRLELTRYTTPHQYLIIKVDKKKFKVDPFYKILKLL